MPKQTATIGRRVYYWPPVNEMTMLADKYQVPQDEAHWEAGIVWVYPPMADGRTSINAAVTLPDGEFVFEENVILADSRETASPGDCYWMPYQVAQATAAPAP